MLAACVETSQTVAHCTQTNYSSTYLPLHNTKHIRTHLTNLRPSVLDEESERFVEQALDNLINSSEHTVMIVALQFSKNGSVAEVSSHDELMPKKDGRYLKLVKLQMEGEHRSTTPQLIKKETTDDTKQPAQQIEKPGEVDETRNKNNQTRARLLARDDEKFLVVGCIEAALAGFVFPVCGIVFANMIDLLFQNVDRCEKSADATDFEYDSCGSYYCSSYCIFVDGSLLH